MGAPDGRLQSLLHSGDREAWSVAALVLALSGAGTTEQNRAALALLTALGLDLDVETAELDRQAVAGQAAAPVLQAATLIRGDGQLWAGQSDDALLAQGHASGQGAAMFARMALPAMDGLAEALATPGARMLDVGVGVGALAVAWAQQFPALTVVGIDVMPRVLALAATTIAASTVADRVHVREQDVAALDESAVYQLAWLPAPFLPAAALEAGVRNVARALAPGGWVLLGHGKFDENPVDVAVSRFKTVAFGGTALDDQQAQTLLSGAGFVGVATLPTPSGAPAITIGRRPVSDPAG